MPGPTTQHTKKTHEAAVGARHCGDETPNWDAVGDSFLTRGVIVGVKKLPGQVSALLPACAFSPDQKHFATRVAYGDGMFAFCIARRRNGLRHFQACGVHAGEEN